MKIYLDDCAYSKRLKRQLEAAGRQVRTPFEAGIPGRPDDVHLRYAAEHGLALRTYNADDFLNLHERYPEHAGVLVVYRDADATKCPTRISYGPSKTYLHQARLSKADPMC